MPKIRYAYVMHSNNFDLQLKFVFCYYFFFYILCLPNVFVAQLYCLRFGQLLQLLAGHGLCLFT